MKINILSIFPNMFDDWLNTSIIKRAVGKNQINIMIDDIRKFTLDKNNRIDDYPTGGGAGLIMQCQPVIDCLQAVKTSDSHIILMSPRGQIFNQKKAHELAQKEHLIFICGHYEGIDERVKNYINEEISIGDYILTGGELPAMVICDSVSRLIEGVISGESTCEESFENGLLEYPQFTTPREYKGKAVPDILFSGNHLAIAKWRLKESLRITQKERPDLLIGRNFTKEELSLLKEIEEKQENPKWLSDALHDAHKFMRKEKS